MIKQNNKFSRFDGIKLKTRMLLYILLTSILVFSTGIGYISIRYKNKAMQDAKNISNAYEKYE